MRSNREIKQESRSILRKGWFWRLATVIAVLNAAGQSAAMALMTAYRHYDISTWSEFLKSKVSFELGQDLAYEVPSRAIAWQLTGASAFESFVIYIFSAIAAFGIAVVALKAAKGEGERWLADSLDGFRSPLGLAWLMFVMNLRVFLWSLVFIVPGIVAIYRYRQAWYFKAEHPDWGASKCLEESSKLMEGHKWRAFELDASFWGWLLLAGLAIGAQMVFNDFFVSLGSWLLLIYVLCYYSTARVVFYRELRHE